MEGIQGVISFMRIFVAVCCLCCLLLSGAVLRFPEGGRLNPVGKALANAQTASTELMQQSDHRRRAERAKKAEAEAEDPQIAAFGVPEGTSGNLDFVVLAILAGSIAFLAIIARRRRRTRRTGFRL